MEAAPEARAVTAPGSLTRLIHVAFVKAAPVRLIARKSGVMVVLRLQVVQALPHDEAVGHEAEHGLGVLQAPPQRCDHERDQSTGLHNVVNKPVVQE